MRLLVIVFQSTQKIGLCIQELLQEFQRFVQKLLELCRILELLVDQIINLQDAANCLRFVLQQTWEPFHVTQKSLFPQNKSHEDELIKLLWVFVRYFQNFQDDFEVFFTDIGCKWIKYFLGNIDQLGVQNALLDGILEVHIAYVIVFLINIVFQHFLERLWKIFMLLLNLEQLYRNRVLEYLFVMLDEAAPVIFWKFHSHFFEEILYAASAKPGQRLWSSAKTAFNNVEEVLDAVVDHLEVLQENVDHRLEGWLGIFLHLIVNILIRLVFLAQRKLKLIKQRPQNAPKYHFPELAVEKLPIFLQDIKQHDDALSLNRDRVVVERYRKRTQNLDPDRIKLLLVLCLNMGWLEFGLCHCGLQLW